MRVSTSAHLKSGGLVENLAGEKDPQIVDLFKDRLRLLLLSEETPKPTPELRGGLG
jgi:hypothetical protein